LVYDDYPFFRVSCNNILSVYNHGKDECHDITYGNLQFDLFAAAVSEGGSCEVHSRDHRGAASRWFSAIIGSSIDNCGVIFQGYFMLEFITWLLTGLDGVKDLDDRQVNKFRESPGNRVYTK